MQMDAGIVNNVRPVIKLPWDLKRVEVKENGEAGQNSHHEEMFFPYLYGAGRIPGLAGHRFILL